VRDVGDLIGAERAAAAGVIRPAENAGLEECAVDDQLTPPVEQVEQAGLAAGPSNAYAASTAIQGIRRRSAARASRAELFLSRTVAASHACDDTTGGACMVDCLPFHPFSADVFMAFEISSFG